MARMIGIAPNKAQSLPRTFDAAVKRPAAVARYPFMANKMIEVRRLPG
jgi:hypothetical protein